MYSYQGFLTNAPIFDDFMEIVFDRHLSSRAFLFLVQKTREYRYLLRGLLIISIFIMFIIHNSSIFIMFYQSIFSYKYQLTLANYFYICDFRWKVAKNMWYVRQLHDDDLSNPISGSRPC